MGVGGLEVGCGFAFSVELEVRAAVLLFSDSSAPPPIITTTVSRTKARPRTIELHFSTFHCLRIRPTAKPTIIAINAANTVRPRIISSASHITNAPSWFRIQRPLQRALPAETIQGRNNAFPNLCGRIKVGIQTYTIWRSLNALCNGFRLSQAETQSQYASAETRRAAVATPTLICHTAMRTNHVAARREG